MTEDTATRVAKFMREFLLPHAFAFYGGVLKLADDHDRLAAIAGYILAHRKERMTNRDVQRGDGTMRKLTRRDTESAFEQLEALGLGDENAGASSDRPASLDRQSCRASEVRRARKGGSRTAEARTGRCCRGARPHDPGCQ